ncbi:hypothetical protein ES703_04505 [subsurface metagenome]
MSDLFLRETPKSENRATRLDWLDDATGIVAGEDEPAGVGVHLHRAPQRVLGVGGQGIGLVQVNDLVGEVAYRERARVVLHLRSNGVYPSFVRRIKLQEIRTPAIAKKFMRYAESRTGLANTRGAGK